MAAAQAGDCVALDALLSRHADRLYALCRRIMGDPDDAADAAQEALISVVRGLPGFDGRSAFSTWAYRVTTNACMDELRRRSRRPDPITDEALDAAAGRPGQGPEDQLERAADRADIDAALATLPPDFRVAVVLRDLLGLDYAEIASVLGIPPGTVRSRIARGRGALADSIALGNPPGAPERPTWRP